MTQWNVISINRSIAIASCVVPPLHELLIQACIHAIVYPCLPAKSIAGFALALYYSKQDEAG
jgi:hypothetical protein